VAAYLVAPKATHTNISSAPPELTFYWTNSTSELEVQGEAPSHVPVVQLYLSANDQQTLDQSDLFLGLFQQFQDRKASVKNLANTPLTYAKIYDPVHQEVVSVFKLIKR